jgi:hypothetical protein
MDRFSWLYYAETPSTSPRLVWFENEDTYHQLEPETLQLNWDLYNLTINKVRSFPLSPSTRRPPWTSPCGDMTRALSSPS